MRRKIEKAIRAADGLVNCTELSYRNRAIIRGFLGAALLMNADPKKVPARHIDLELRAHLGDALKPLGSRVVRRAPTIRKSELRSNRDKNTR
jgi:hypothetical protein